MNNKKISAVVNTLNEAELLESCLQSISFVDEIVVVDMHSTDKSRDIAYRYTDSVYLHEPLNFVEPARNFAIKKAKYEWILVVDPDETIPKNLAAKLRQIVNEDQADFVRLPRQNIIFGNWIKHSRWWPDYNIRFFKKNFVEWQNTIHSIPITQGRGLNLPEEEKFAIKHNHYTSVEQYISRSLRYSEVQALELIEQKYQFDPIDAFTRPVSEFLSRYFAGEGYKDGLHGLVLATLQAFSVFLVYLKVWQKQSFPAHKEIEVQRLIKKPLKRKINEFNYWYYTMLIQQNPKKIVRALLKLTRKIKCQ